MFIIDEIYDSEGNQLGTDLPGGAGTYALIGARFFHEPPSSKKLSMIIDMGTDFPSSTLKTLNSLHCSLLLRPTPSRLTTRGLNTYGPDELRNFSYMTPKLPLETHDLTPELVSSKTFHLICNPTRAQDLVATILRRRKELGILKRPMILWEPVPGVCRPEDWEACQRAMRLVDVTSPNIYEAASFMGLEIDEGESFSRFKCQVEDLARMFVKEVSEGGVVIFRCGRHGCLVSRGEEMEWLPAYHRTMEKVVDPTGGGNSFCGGFCAGYVLEKGDVVEAAKYGNVAASFVIEQFGLPELGYGMGGEELWNGESVMHRRHIYHDYVERIPYGE